MINTSHITQVDNNNMLGTINKLPGQIWSAWSDKDFDYLEKSNFDFNRVVVAGMGSSLIAFKLLNSAYENNFTIPIYIANKEVLPNWIDKQTLVIVSSYSGNSIETVSCAKQALLKKCQVIAIFSGGKLEKMRNKFNFSYKLRPELNYCAQPRLAIGYSLSSYLKIFQILKILNNHLIIDQQVQQSISKLNKLVKDKKIHERAFSLAKFINHSFIDIVGTDFLTANAELMAKQISWNGKHQASFTFIPEAMHFINEGVFDKNLNKVRRIVFLTSNLLSKTNQKLIQILISYFKLNRIKTKKIEFKDKRVLEAILVRALFSSYVSFYLAIINKQNPTPTSGINYYKKKMYG